MQICYLQYGHAKDTSAANVARPLVVGCACVMQLEARPRHCRLAKENQRRLVQVQESVHTGYYRLVFAGLFIHIFVHPFFVLVIRIEVVEKGLGNSLRDFLFEGERDARVFETLIERPVDPRKLRRRCRRWGTRRGSMRLRRVTCECRQELPGGVVYYCALGLVHPLEVVIVGPRILSIKGELLKNLQMTQAAFMTLSLFCLMRLLFLAINTPTVTRS